MAAGEFQLAKWFVEIGEKGSGKVLRTLDSVNVRSSVCPEISLQIFTGVSVVLGAAGVGLTLAAIAKHGAEAESALARFNTVFANTQKGGFAAGFNLDELTIIAKTVGRTKLFGELEVKNAMRELLDIGKVTGKDFVTAWKWPETTPTRTRFQ